MNLSTIVSLNFPTLSALAILPSNLEKQRGLHGCSFLLLSWALNILKIQFTAKATLMV